MIEREATVKISSELLANLLNGTKAVNGRLVRIAEMVEQWGALPLAPPPGR